VVSTRCYAAWHAPVESRFNPGYCLAVGASLALLSPAQPTGQTPEIMMSGRRALGTGIGIKKASRQCFDQLGRLLQLVALRRAMQQFAISLHYEVCACGHHELPPADRQPWVWRCVIAPRVLCAIALAISALPVFAQFRAVPGREYREYFNPVNPVRGEAVIGLAIAPTEAQQRAVAVQVLLPASFSGEIHLETASADGKFRGEGVFAGTTKDKEWVSLPLTATAPPDGKPPLARPASPLLLAVAARGSGGSMFIVRWGDASPAAPPDLVRLYLNSRRADMFVRAGAKIVRCAPIGVSQPVRFDSFCDVSLSDIPANGQLSIIRRDQFDEQTQTLKVQVP